MKTWRRKQGVGAATATGNGEAARVVNPYLNARREWNSQTERAFSQLHVWQLVGVAGLLLGLGGVAGMAYVGSQSKIRPYVMVINPSGEVTPIGLAQPAGPADPRVIRAELASFIENARMVTPDISLLKESILRVSAMIRTKDPAMEKMSEWLGLGVVHLFGSTSTPEERAKKITVSVQVESVAQVSDTSWQADWLETTRDRDGSLVSKPQHMRAVLAVYVVAPSDAAREIDIARNPIGVYVRDFNWEEI